MKHEANVSTISYNLFLNISRVIRKCGENEVWLLLYLSIFRKNVNFLTEIKMIFWGSFEGGLICIKLGSFMQIAKQVGRYQVIVGALILKTKDNHFKI